MSILDEGQLMRDWAKAKIVPDEMSLLDLWATELSNAQRAADSGDVEQIRSAAGKLSIVTAVLGKAIEDDKDPRMIPGNAEVAAMVVRELRDITRDPWEIGRLE